MANHTVPRIQLPPFGSLITLPGGRHTVVEFKYRKQQEPFQQTPIQAPNIQVIRKPLISHFQHAFTLHFLTLKI